LRRSKENSRRGLMQSVKTQSVIRNQPQWRSSNVQASMMWFENPKTRMQYQLLHGMTSRKWTSHST
jgi:hypothetical protein